MTVVVSNGHASVAAARDASISDVKEGMDQLHAAVQSFSTSNNIFDDAVDKAQRQRVIEAAQTVLNAVKRPDDVWVDSKLHVVTSQPHLSFPKTYCRPARLLWKHS